jgi:sensor histidine kinase YesM/ligand-binding sensor domain-containing protein
MQRCFFCVAMILMLTVCRAQTPYYTNASVYTDKEGFDVPEIISNINEDNNGLIWIGTENGLYSFNGTQFKVFRHDPKDSNSLPSNFVNFNYQDKQGIYWVYIPAKGLYNYEPGTQSFQKYHYKNEKEFDIHSSYKIQIGVPFEDSHNRLWLPLPGFGLAEVDRKNAIIHPYKICFPNDCGDYYDPSWVTRIVEDAQSKKFLLATNGGLVSFDPLTGNAVLLEEKNIRQEIKKNTFETELSPQQNTLTYFGPQCGNNIWMGTWGDGIKKFNAKTKTFKTFLWAPKKWDGTNNICAGIWVKDSTHLWITTRDAGIYIFDTTTNIFQPVKISNYYFADHYGISLRSKDGTLWLWQSPAALLKLNSKNLFNTYTLKTKNASEQIGFFSSVNNKLFMCGEFSKGIYQFDKKNYSTVYYPSPASGHTSFLLSYPDKHGIYMGGDYGLLFFNVLTNKFEQPAKDNTSKSLLSKYWFAATKRKDGSIWLAGYTDEILNFNPVTGVIKKFPLGVNQQTRLHNNAISEMVEDGERLWFASNPLGLGCMDIQTGKITFFNVTRNSQYPTGQSLSICLKDSSVFFTVLSNGLWQLKYPFTNKETCINYTEKDGLPGNWIRYVLPAAKHAIWLFSTKGITLFDPVTHTEKNFSEPEGLLDKNIFYTPWQSADDSAYIGFINSFQSYDPHTLENDSTVTYKIIINDFKVNNSSLHDNINFYKELVLKPYENNISFEFAAITHGNAQVLNYTYQLQDFDKDAIQSGNSTKGSYNNLPAGNYTLKIGLDGVSENTNNSFSLPVVIKPYWYNTNIFRLILALLLIALLYAFYRYRINIYRREVSLKAEFDKKIAEIEIRALRAQMNPHFIFNCLTSINRYIVKSDHKTASNYLTKFSKLIRMILDNSANDYILLETEMQTLQLYMDMELLRFDNAFEYEIEKDDTLYEENMQIPSMLIQPYIENAIWHGLMHKETKGKLWLRFTGEKDMLKVVIEDNGIGRIKAEALRSKDVIKNKSYGMQISRDRIMLIRNIYKIQSSVEVIDLNDENGNASGTKIILRMPFFTNA